jgi:acetyl esterase
MQVRGIQDGHIETEIRPMTIESATLSFLESIAASGIPPLYTLTPEGARKFLSGTQAATAIAPPTDIEDHAVATGPTGSMRIRIVRPRGVGSRLPIVMYFHGGGWMTGGVDTHDRLIREIAHGASVAVVFVEYDRSPESRYPVAIEQAYAATRYFADHAGDFNLDASRLALAGDNVGGNMAAVVSLLAKERKGPAIRFQILFYPVTNAEFENDSYRQFADGPWLTRATMKWFWNAYLPDDTKRKHRSASPLHATPEQLRDLPPALIITAENDVLRDEGEAYAEKLTQAGVCVTAVRYKATIHDFVMFNALRQTPASCSAIELATAALRRMLTQ